MSSHSHRMVLKKSFRRERVSELRSPHESQCSTTPSRSKARLRNLPALLRVLVVLAFLFSGASGIHGQQSVLPFFVPPENPITPEKAVLGKILFWEEQMSSNNSVACGTCHMPEAGGGDLRTGNLVDASNLNPGPDGLFGTSDDIRGSRGHIRCDDTSLVNDGVYFPRSQVTGRKAPSFIGAMFDGDTFWDGRARGEFRDPDTNAVVIPYGGALESQALGPPASDVEMGCMNRTLDNVVARLQTSRPLRLATNLTPDIVSALAAHPTYPDLFAWAFGSPGITKVRIAMAIATYERTLVPDQTPFDDWNTGMNPLAMTPDQVQGFNLFHNVLNCSICHQPPLFTNSTFNNIGVRPNVEDVGRMAVTGDPLDAGKFKSPGLRNVGLRAPYFHNGGKDTIADVLVFYSIGGDFPNEPNHDPDIFPLNLTAEEMGLIEDFLVNALTDPRVAAALPPFDRPTLNSELPPNPLVFGSGSPGFPGSAPRIVAPSPPMLGSHFFHLGIHGGPAGSPAMVVFSTTPAPPGATIGVDPLHVGLVPAPLVLSRTLTGPGDPKGDGMDTITLAIPDDASLLGDVYYAQWFVLDPAAPNNGLAVSDGVAITIFAP